MASPVLAQLTPRPALVVRGLAFPGSPEMDAQVDAGYVDLVAFLQREGIAAAGPSFFRYLDMTDDGFSFELGYPLALPVTGNVRVACVELPGGEAAVLMHAGPYYTLGLSYDLLNEWIVGQGRVAGGAPWDEFVVTGADVADSQLWRTRIVQPLAPQ